MASCLFRDVSGEINRQRMGREQGAIFPKGSWFKTAPEEPMKNNENDATETVISSSEIGDNFLISIVAIYLINHKIRIPEIFNHS
jgi:hypothetical protein